ncbi:hypothetical protein Syun_017685 [Stephania yunnanensis]|uniref:lipoyl(octanoyl) transferase n=1 Tax=Stephania yunnanensis TaxID=152371 RepID=A0AAP0P3A0_9MAGN
MILCTTPSFLWPWKCSAIVHSQGPLSPKTDFRASDTTIMQTHNKSLRSCECFDLHNEIVPYNKAWSWQKSMVRKRHTLIEKDEDYSDTLIVLQHPPVYTLGSGSSEEYLNFDKLNAPFDIYRTERGGEVTYHGPGQLVMYPILNLRHHKMDLHWYLRALEEVVIRTLFSTFSIKADRNAGFTGVWVGDCKLAAIGIRVSKWTTYHGLALNVTADLSPFQHIVPCGIRNRRVGNIKGLLDESRFSNGSERNIVLHTETVQLLDVTCESLLKEFSEVFQLALQCKPMSDRELL